MMAIVRSEEYESVGSRRPLAILSAPLRVVAGTEVQEPRVRVSS